MTWAVHESRIVTPFFTDHGSLSETAMRLSSDEDFEKTRNRWIDVDDELHKLEPELRFGVNDRQLKHRTQVRPEDLALHVVLRDRAARWWSVLESWPLREVPETYRVQYPSESYAVGLRTEIGILISPYKQLDEKPGVAWRRDQVVARTEFLIAQEVDGTRFNIQTQPPEWFVERKLPADTVWTVRWFSVDVRQPPLDALTVVINETFYENVSKLMGQSRGSAWASHQLAIEVFTEVAQVTLAGADDYIDEPGSILDVVCNQLGIDSDASLQVFKAALDAPQLGVTAASMIRSRVQSNTRLHKHLSDLGLEKT